MYKYFGKILKIENKAKMRLDKRDEFQKRLEKLAGQDIELWIGKRGYLRSLQQNAYYWGVIVEMISEETGHTPEEVHAFAKGMFLKKWITFKDKEIEIIRSTTELDKAEFEDYAEKVRRWAASELSLSIPLPNECDIFDLEPEPKEISWIPYRKKE